MHALGQRSLPIGTDNRVVSGFGSRCARADIGEIVAHEVDDLHCVVAIRDFRNREDDLSWTPDLGPSAKV